MSFLTTRAQARPVPQDSSFLSLAIHEDVGIIALARLALEHAVGDQPDLNNEKPSITWVRPVLRYAQPSCCRLIVSFQIFVMCLIRPPSNSMQ